MVVDVLLALTCPFTSVCTLVYVHVLYIYTQNTCICHTHAEKYTYMPWPSLFFTFGPVASVLYPVVTDILFWDKKQLDCVTRDLTNPGLSSGPTGNFLRAIRKWWGVFYLSIVWSSEEDEARWKTAPKKRVCDCHLGGIHRRPLLRMLRGDNCFSQSHSSTWSTGPDKQWPWGSWGSS